MAIPPPRWTGWRAPLAGGLAFFALARFSSILATLHGAISPVWPATGLGIWLMLLGGRKMWAAIAAGELLVNLVNGLPPWVATVMAVGSVGEAQLGAWFWRRIQDRFAGLSPSQRVLMCSVLVAIVAPVAGASLGTMALFAGHITPAAALPHTWITWWIGDALGALFVVPVLLAAPVLAAWLRHASGRERTKCLAVLVLAGGICRLAFFGSNVPGYVFGIFPVLLVAALWVDAPLAGAVALLTAIAAIMGTYSGHGPFASGDQNQDLINIQIFLVASAVMGQLLPTFRGSKSHLPAAILLVGWLLSGVIFTNMLRNQAQTDRANFAALSDKATKDIEDRLTGYTDALVSCRSFLLASPSAGRAGWATFVGALDLDRHFSGINGLGVVYPVPSQEAAAFTERIRRENAAFAIHPVPGAGPAGPHDPYVVTYLAPASRTGASVGMDIASEGIRRHAAEVARDRGGEQMTTLMTLVQDQRKRQGLLLYLPVYRPGAALTSVAERRSALQAWVYASFVADHMMQSWLTQSNQTLSLDFFAGNTTDAAHRLYASESSPAEPGTFDVLRTIAFAGQSFTLGWNPGPEFVRSNRSPTLWTSLSFALGTLLSAGLVRSLQTVRQRAEDLVQVRTLELREEMGRREEIAETLREARRVAEAANKAKSEFLAMISHEIRTPMNAVLGFAELLVDSPLSPQQREFVGIIQFSSHNLILLINDILDLSKIEAGKFEIDRERFDGVAVAESAAAIFALQAKAKGLWLRTSLAPDLPRVLESDPNRLRQVLINLLSNALKFTSAGGISIAVETAAGPAPGALRFTVTDTGIGISAEKQATLFQNFTQADSSITRQYGGTGLGLAISKRLVELMGGRIGMSSVPGEGSSLWLELPLSPDQTPLAVTAPLPAAAAPAVTPESAEATLPAGISRRILVADDNPLNRRLIRLLLDKLNYEPVGANNGAEAVRLVQTYPVDLVLMDHQMPVMDGCEAAKAIRAWEKAEGRKERLPIIALTANATADCELLYQSVGMDAHLSKPLKFAELAEAIHALLNPAAPVLPSAPTVDSPPPETPAGPSAPLMDIPQALLQLGNDARLLRMLGKAFTGQIDLLLGELKTAVAERDLEAVRQRAHKLKGSVGCFAAEAIWSRAQSLEETGASPDWALVESQVRYVATDARRLCTELAELPAGAQAAPQLANA